MTFMFSCPYCKQKLEAEDELIGKMLECPACGKTITVNKEYEDKINSGNLEDNISTENKKEQNLKKTVTEFNQINNQNGTISKTAINISMIFSIVSLCLSLICFFYIIPIEKNKTSENNLYDGLVKKIGKFGKKHNYISKRQMTILKTQPSPAFMRAEKLSGTMELVVVCGLGNYYIPLIDKVDDKWSKYRYYSIYCKSVDFTVEGYAIFGLDNYGYGFALRTSDVGKKLIGILKDGKEHFATIKIQNISYDGLAGMANFLIIDVSEINPEAYKPQIKK